MSREELKIYLHKSIERIDDKNRLQIIKEMISHFSMDNSDVVLNENQKKRISEAKCQISNGEYTSENQVREEVKKWLER